ncbi:hypothetical protein FB446DRAFT_784762 [Lentinula raphanica]|nr:hypothetical protein FB446DRAFT_784762 [Lentinula raphanica]
MSTDKEVTLEDSEEVTLYGQRLFDYEIFWRDHYEWLKCKGYLLRPRYHPNWVPSWLGSTRSPLSFEDSRTRPLISLNLDAIRVSDGQPVMLRLADPPSLSDELKIGRLVSSMDSQSDPRNHCVPIYETFEIPKASASGRKVIVVMPYLAPWDKAEFRTVGEVVDFCSQVFEGLQFMHNHIIAHNDAKNNNIMMDWSPLYPIPVQYLRTFTFPPEEWTGRDHRIPQYNATIRTTRTPVRLPGYGGDSTVPEFKRNEPCNPFAVDVYCLGNVIRQKFIEGDPIVEDPPRRNVGFLRELIADMTHDDPLKRPTMDEVVARFEEIRGRLSWWCLRSKVSDKTIPYVFHALYSPIHWSIQLLYILRQKPAIPRHTPRKHYNARA